jgi:DNA-binding response OmpR family regulator
MPDFFPENIRLKFRVIKRTVSRALLIHDDPGQRGLALDALSRSALNTTVLCNGKQAWLYLFQSQSPLEQPDLVILRVGLSPVSGLEILKQMRLGKGTKEIPVILLADSDEEKRALEILDLPLCFCFVKPLTFVKIIYALPRLNLSISDSLLYSEA